MRGCSRTGNTRQGRERRGRLFSLFTSPLSIFPFHPSLLQLSPSPCSASPSHPGGCCHRTYYEDEENSPSQSASVRVHRTASLPRQGKEQYHLRKMSAYDTLIPFFLLLPSFITPFPPSSPPSVSLTLIPQT